MTLEIAQQQLRDVFSSLDQKSISIDIMQRIVAEYFGLSQAISRERREPRRSPFRASSPCTSPGR